jgi:cholesterol transport system auxiliary component
MMGRELATPRVTLILTCLALGGCALASKGEALSPRYFSPTIESASEPIRADRLEHGAVSIQPELRVGRVEPAAYLEERIAYRVSQQELAYYEDRRWTEPPEQFVRRALERELFETQAFRRVLSGPAPTLDVDVLSFEELRQGPRRAHLGLRITLRDERHALLERTVTALAPLELGATEDEGTALAAAMASALARAAREIAGRVSAELETEGRDQNPADREHGP